MCSWLNDSSQPCFPSTCVQILYSPAHSFIKEHQTECVNFHTVRPSPLMFSNVSPPTEPNVNNHVPSLHWKEQQEEKVTIDPTFSIVVSTRSGDSWANLDRIREFWSRKSSPLPLFLRVDYCDWLNQLRDVDSLAWRWLVFLLDSVCLCVLCCLLPVAFSYFFSSIFSTSDCRLCTHKPPYGLWSKSDHWFWLFIKGFTSCIVDCIWIQGWVCSDYIRPLSFLLCSHSIFCNLAC